MKDILIPNTTIIKRYLIDYIKLKNPQYAVLLKGKWGCGKTHFIKEWMNEISSHLNENFNAKGKIKMKSVYVSLNGKNTIQQITTELKKQLFPIIYSKGPRLAMKVFNGISQKYIGTSFDDLPAIGSDELLFILEKANKFLIGTKILIFDDLERCRVPIDEIFGFLNTFVEHSDCRVIIIGEENMILESGNNESDKSTSYKHFKEKLIGQSFELVQDNQTIINQFAAASKINTNNLDIAISVFNTSKINNLRIIKQCFSDFERLRNLIPQKFSKDTILNGNFSRFLRNTFAYFILTYCEYKSGNLEISKYDFAFNNVLLQRDNDYNPDTDLVLKYQPTLDFYDIDIGYYSLGIDAIIEFIKTGFLQDIEQILDNNPLFQQNIREDWEILWSFFDLDNTQFKNNLSLLKTRLRTTNCSHIGEVLQICGILLTLKQEKLLSMTSDEIVSLSKNNIAKIVERLDEDNADITNIGSILRYQHKAIHNENSLEIIDLKNYAELKLKERNYHLKNDRFNDIMLNMNDENIRILSQDFQNLNLIESVKFEDLDFKRVACNITNISNHSKRKIFNFFHYVNSSIIHIESIPHQNCISFFENLSSELCACLIDFQYIDKFWIESIIRNLNQITESMRAFEQEETR